MGWASAHIERLSAGETVKFRPHGGSMAGLIESGELCTVVPISDAAGIEIGQIVLCKVGGAQYLHLVKDISHGRYLIGNNRGGINGWIEAKAIFGLCTAVEP